MLVLTRKLGQKIRIGSGVNSAVVCIVGISPEGQVRLGIEADKSVPVWRWELDEGQGAGLRSKEYNHG